MAKEKLTQHRGRFQAQGNKTEKSVKWVKTIPITKAEGGESLSRLENKLTPAELKQRVNCFDQARKYINRVSAIGISAPVIHSFTPIPPKGNIRVDIEVRAGVAFIDK